MKFLRSLFKFSSTIRMKLVTVSVLLLTIPLIILGIFSYQKSGSSLDELGATNLENSVAMTIEMIESLNEEVEKGTIPLEEAQEKVKVGILGEKDQEGLRPINQNIDLGEFGYMFIADSNGNLLSHPTIEGENTWDNKDINGHYYAQEYIEIGLDGGGLSYYSYPLPNDQNQIEEKVTYSKAFPEWDWVIVASTYMLDFNAPANEILTIIMVVIGATLFVGIIIIWLFANSISRPVNTVVDHMNHLADGDLTLDQIEIKSKDETGQLATAMNHMQAGLRDIISNVAEASEIITSQSEELTQAANEVRVGSEQVAVTMEELATGSESQANHSSDLSEMMGSFVTKVDDANENGEHIQESSGEVLELTNEGSQLMDASMKEMEIIDKIVHDAVEKVEGLDAHSQEISELVSVIQDIAEQTNLLALNAAIEAARAGEHGQGFAVVADEVRQLAEQSAASVTDITDIVNRIQEESSVVSSSLQSGYKDVESGAAQIAATGKTFNEINASVTDVVENISQVSENLADIAANSQEMNSSIQEIAAISEESAAGVEQTSASSQQSSSAMDEVANNSTDLAKLAEELNEVVRQFRL